MYIHNLSYTILFILNQNCMKWHDYQYKLMIFGQKRRRSIKICHYQYIPSQKYWVGTLDMVKTWKNLCLCYFTAYFTDDLKKQILDVDFFHSFSSSQTDRHPQKNCDHWISARTTKSDGSFRKQTNWNQLNTKPNNIQ